MSYIPINLNVAKKIVEWGFMYQLWRAREPTYPTYHPNNTCESTLTTKHNNNTTTIPYCHNNNTKSTKTNKQPIAFKEDMWINQQLENAIDAMERGHTCSKKASRYWNIMLTLLLDHLSGRIEIKKVGP
jgi:hypothetical protein